MVRPRVHVTAALVTFLLLVNVYPYEARSVCRSCSVFPYLDSPGNDIVEFSDKLPVECADLCSSAEEECQGFVISPDRRCWLKRSLQPSASFTTNDARTVVVTGGNNCQGLFSS